MRGKVVAGRIEVEADLPKGSIVIVLAPEGDETFEADSETEAMLLHAIDQCNRGQTKSMADVLADLRSHK